MSMRILQLGIIMLSFMQVTIVITSQEHRNRDLVIHQWEKSKDKLCIWCVLHPLLYTRDNLGSNPKQDQHFLWHTLVHGLAGRWFTLDASLEKTLVSYIFNAIILHNYSLSSPHFGRITRKTSLKNILYGHQQHQQHIQVEFNDEIFNEALISTYLDSKIKDRPYHRHFRERLATIYPSCKFLFSTIYQNLLNKMKHMSSQWKVTKSRLYFLNVLGGTEKTLSILSLQTCIKIGILRWQ